MKANFEIGRSYALNMDENGNFIWREADTTETGYQCKPNELTPLQLADYKLTAEQIKGYPVRCTHNVNGKPTTIEATLRGVSFDKTNNRATFATASGRAVATFHRFTVLAEVTKTEATTETDNRPAAMIRADIQALTERIGKLQAKLATLREALATAQIEDLKAVSRTLVTQGVVQQADEMPNLTIFRHAPTSLTFDGWMAILPHLLTGARQAAQIDDTTREDIRYYNDADELSPREQRAAEALGNEVGDEVWNVICGFTDHAITAAAAVARVIAERGLKVDEIDFATLPYSTDTTDTTEATEPTEATDTTDTTDEGEKPAKPKRQGKK